MVQKISVWWDSKLNSLNLVQTKDVFIIKRTNIKIEKIMIIVWSWNIIICSIKGEFLFWNIILFHIGIYLNTISVWLKVWNWGGQLKFHSLLKLGVGV